MTSLTPPGLVGQLITAVYEEVFLWEIGGEATEYLGNDRTVTHGPWDLAACRGVLLRWFDEGWIDCIAIARSRSVDDSRQVEHLHSCWSWFERAARHGDYFVLARADARALLSDSNAWSSDGPGGQVQLCRSDGTDGMTYSDWLRPVHDIGSVALDE